jgi:hypothetical protein
MKSKKKALFVIIAIFLGLGSVANAQEGVELGEAVSVTAEVVYIDKQDRIVVLRGSEEKYVEIDVPEEARNFDQIRVGDQVKVTYYESVALFLGDAGTLPDENVDVVAARSKKGEKPGGLVIGTVDISALVMQIDKENQKVYLQDPGGNTVAVSVDPSLNDLKDMKAGDLVHARFTKAVAISVEKGM